MAAKDEKLGLVIPTWFWLNTFKQTMSITRVTADSLSLAP